MHPVEMTPALAEAIEATSAAGWELPLEMVRSTFPSTRDGWDITEADGTRIAIVGHEADGRLIIAALSYVLS